MGVGAKVELTFDPGDLGHVNVLDHQKEAYIRVPAVDQGYAKGLSFWQNKVIRRYAQRQLDARKYGGQEHSPPGTAEALPCAPVGAR